MMQIYNSLLFFYLAVGFNFVKFSFQIFLRVVVEKSTNFSSYIDQIIDTALVWLLSQLLILF
jgi:hypothetical protein